MSTEGFNNAKRDYVEDAAPSGWPEDAEHTPGPVGFVIISMACCVLLVVVCRFSGFGWVGALMTGWLGGIVIALGLAFGLVALADRRERHIENTRAKPRPVSALTVVPQETPDIATDPPDRVKALFPRKTDHPIILTLPEDQIDAMLTEWWKDKEKECAYARWELDKWRDSATDKIDMKIIFNVIRNKGESS